MLIYYLLRQARDNPSFFFANVDVIREMPGLCTCGQPASTILEICVISNHGLFNYYKFIGQIIPVDEAVDEIKWN